MSDTADPRIPHTDDLDEHMLDRVFAGEASPVEEMRYRAWASANPLAAQRLDTLRTTLEMLGTSEVSEYAPEIAEGFAARAKVGTRGVPEEVSRTAGLRRWPLRRAVLGGGSLRRGLLVGTLSLVITGLFGTLARNSKDTHRTRIPLVRTYATLAGRQANITFADSSRAQLGPATTLTVAIDPDGGRIDIRVVGEALFTVAHRPRISFQVRTRNAVTRVLGTTFLVRQYPTDSMTRIVVADGRVSLAWVRRDIRYSEAILTTRMLGVIEDSGTVQLTPNIAVDDYTEWTRGRLVFHNALARDVVAELGRAYDVEIRIADSALAAQHINWTVPLAQRSLSGILESLVDVLDAHPVRAGRVITFIPGRSAGYRLRALPPSSAEGRQYGK